MRIRCRRWCLGEGLGGRGCEGLGSYLFLAARFYELGQSFFKEGALMWGLCLLVVELVVSLKYFTLSLIRMYGHISKCP
jgi:hypothetical protein